ncbi:chemotaxis protein CheR [Panacibacter ginsenosidivorans]|uniref:Chemotaxis protein CheR n=1 Tax=Panacibacter ginsenosidivorans TaxID=1813871 RepID=A0A5B8V3J8_9BACT|nr:CheR family methyltransferase [Panacibacter ginsenosidivorans]QEC66000.1 chemotaxis protein CheR [Panacibacter ginsenosidivorans]
MKNEQYIIAIGASAGGLQEINSFFDHTPLDGVSYIVIQHLSADYKSMMAALLAKHTKLKVVEAQNNMFVESNNIYLIPSTNIMTIDDGRLLLTDKVKGIPNRTINTFFNSLANERGNKAIGIILSGTGSDGTEGIEAIKNGGGMVIVSDPKTAEFNEMPISAIASGNADYVVEPEQMPNIIEQYVAEKTKLPDEEFSNEEEEKIMGNITDLIKEQLPVDFSDYKTTTIFRRIRRRASLLNYRNMESYFGLLKTNKAELQILAKDFLISVTSFFRDPDAFEILKTKVIPGIIKDKSNGEEIKIWVAGCATGEEAYSLAMLVQEELTATQKDNTVKIFATDIDSDALQFAAKGVYNERNIKNLSPERLEMFFTKQANGYKIKDGIRKMLIFAHHDLVKNPPYCNMDIISCRNLLIYMKHDLQKKIFHLLHFGLCNGGYLFLGPSENISEITSSFEEIDKKWKIYKNIEKKRVLNFESLTPVIIERKVSASPHGQKDPKENNKTALPEAFDKELMITLGYAGLWVDENNQVISSFGDTSKLLLQKLFNHNLVDLLQKTLAIAYSTAALEADKRNETIVVKEINVMINSSASAATLIVKPLTIHEDGSKERLVLLKENESLSVSGKNQRLFDEKVFAGEYLVNIEKELKETKEKLASTYELLRASDENMQSFNEELLSANEELQSTNEEMQSVNEELHTVNAEYDLRNRELSNLNDDLNNYFRSNINGQIFVSRDLLLKKFSPGAAKHINLLETDIGRPLSNISINIKFETIEQDVKEVVRSGGVITREVEATNGKWYQVMTMPYIRQADNTIDGAIITFNDITELKIIQQELDEKNKSLTLINADLDNFVYTASHDLLGPVANIEQIIYMLEDKKTLFDEEVVDYLNMLSSAVNKFKTVIKDLTKISQLENTKEEKELINIDEMIDDIIESIQDKVTATNAQVRRELNVAEIRFSTKNFRSVVYNLINNALKFRSPSRVPEIMIRTEELDDFILLTVKDNGIGMDESKIDTIFKMYGRLNDDIEGQGLGLFLIKKIINASGGKIEVESEAGKGTTFKIFFKK